MNDDVSADDPELAKIWASYEAMFGQMPPLPGRRIKTLAGVARDGLLADEVYRARGFYPESLDQKTVQLLLFALLLGEGSAPAKWHAIAARRAGADPAQLRDVVTLVAAIKALGPLNTGHVMLADLDGTEADDAGR